MSEFDVVLANAVVLDGTRDARPVPCDVGIHGGLIGALGDLSARSRTATLDLGGQYATPGFIDTHTHAELIAFQNGADKNAPIAQGVTTILTGADGFCWVGLPEAERLRWWQDSAAIYGPIPEHLPQWTRPSDFLTAIRAVTQGSVIPMVPHGNVRAVVMGSNPRKPTAHELNAMASLVDDWIDEGAVGMASGLDYLPGRYASTDEIVALCQVVAERGGVYSSHLRLADLGRANAWREAAEIGQRAGLGVRIAHERLDGEGAALLDELSVGLDLLADSHLSAAGCTSLAFHVPPEMMADGVMALARRLRSDSGIASELANILDDKLATRPGQSEIIAATTSGSLEGMTLSDLAHERGETVGRAAVFMLAEEMPCAQLVYVWQSPAEDWDVIFKRTLEDDRVMIASDGIYHGSHTHPRGFGVFPRALGHLSRDLELVPLPMAVHKMTGLPAAAYGLSDRGLVEPGKRADLVVFDPTVVDGPAEIGDPRRPPVGIQRVIVGGETVWRPENAR